MKWIEIITLRSPGDIDRELVDELLKGVDESDVASDTPNHLVEIKIYHHSVVETDLSIHIYWDSEIGSQHKSPLGLSLSFALKPLGLLNHSVWVETAAREFVAHNWDEETDTGKRNKRREKEDDRVHSLHHLPEEVHHEG
jgi:hypothetical protein